MQNPLIKRLLGLLWLGIGIGMALWLKHVHDTGARIEDEAIIVTPIMILYGLAGMIHPGLIFSRRQAAQTPMHLRVMGFLIVIIGAGIGVWLRYVVFKDWR